MPEEGPVLTARGISKRYGDHAVLANVSLEVGSAEVVCLLGPSGCGKSTLAKICASLLNPDSGAVLVSGIEVHEPDPTRFMVFQEQDQVFPWKTAMGNVGYPLRILGEREWKSRALAMLAEVGLADSATKYPYQLSGGMKQRVALARAFALEPRVLIMDEPFSGVDVSRRVVLQDLLVSLVLKHQQSVLFVTHEIDEAIRLADRILIMSRDGEVTANLVVEMERPRDPRSAAGNALARDILSRMDNQTDGVTGIQD